MFTFLNTAILVGLAAVAIPVIIHLFTRQQQKTISFSSLRFLKELQQQKIRRLKIRQILLLILRTLLILLLILAFARPTLKGRDAASLESGAQLTAVIILDNTLSMAREKDGQRLLDLARKRALDVAGLLRNGDEMYLLYPQSPAKFAHPEPRFTPEAAVELIENTRLACTTTDYQGALQLATQVMQNSQNVNKEIYLISDQQKIGLKSTAVDTTLRFDEDVRFLILNVAAPENDNLTIDKVTFGNQILEKGKVLEINAKIKNNGSRTVSDRLLHLFVDGKRLAQTALNLAPGALQTVAFNIIPDTFGLQSGYMLLEDDDLLEDNRRYFSFNIPAEMPVLLVGFKETDTRYLRFALTPKKQVNTNISIKEINYQSLPDESLNNFAAIVLSNVPRLSGTIVQHLQRFVAAGGGLLVLPGPDVDLRNYNDGLHKKLALPALGEVFEGQKDAYLTFGNIDFSHPIFQGVFKDEKEIGSPYIHRAVSVRSERPLDKIIEYGNSMPFLFESRYQKGRILYITTGLSSSWSDLTMRGLFVPLINRSMVYLSHLTPVSNTECLIGDEISFAPNIPNTGGDVVIQKPDGNEVKVAPEIGTAGYLIRFQDTDLPGVYRLLSQGKLQTLWAVNPDPAESEPESFDGVYLKEYFKLIEVTIVDEKENLASILQVNRFGNEVWKILLVLALVVLLVETLLLKERPVAAD